MANEIWVRESPFYVTIGEALEFTHTWAGSGAAISNSTSGLYFNGNDVAATYLSSTTSSTGRVQTSKRFTPTVEGKYVLIFKATVDGNTEIRKCEMIVQKAGSEQ